MVDRTLSQLKKMIRGLWQRNRDAEPPYGKCGAIFTPAERSFLDILEEAVAGRYRVFGKVRLMDLLSVESGLKGRESQNSLDILLVAGIAVLHVDFVLCDVTDLSVAGVVEFDDGSHTNAENVLVGQVLHTAGIPLIRMSAQTDYSLLDVKVALLEKLPETAPDAHRKEEPESEVRHVDSGDSEANKDCPACGAPMVRRVTRKGPNAGKVFWGCSKFPKCKESISIDKT